MWIRLSDTQYINMSNIEHIETEHRTISKETGKGKTKKTEDKEVWLVIFKAGINVYQKGFETEHDMKVFMMGLTKTIATQKLRT